MPSNNEAAGKKSPRAAHVLVDKRGGRRLGRLLFLLLAALSSGCLSFRSVTAAGSIGQLVGARATAIPPLLLYCDAENILAGAVKTCPRERVDAYVKELSAYSQGLAKYATGLRNLAEYNDARVGDPLRLITYGAERLQYFTLQPLDATSQSMAAGAFQLGLLITQEWRRKELKKVIITAHPHVVAVINGLVSRAALLGEPIKYIADRGISDRRRTLVEIERSAPATDLIGRQQRQNQQLTLLQLEFFLRNGHDALVNYTKALLAFRRAHEILFASVTVRKSLGERDQEIYDLLKKDLPPLLQ